MSMDLKAENIAQLKALFPEAVTEGKIDFEVLKALLGGEIETRQEYYKFTWNGKEAARAYARTRSMGTLRPCVEESSGKDGTPGKFDSENLYIEGDNLEVLKLLQGAYHKKVKMIYIDPPYNTGKDFIYPDNYRDSIKNYKELTGQTDAEGKSTRANPETSGRYHTDWLNMMYPRLILARNLLADDGVIFISIGEHEIDNLKKLCIDVFGENNIIENYIWESTFRPDNSSPIIRRNAEYVLCFSREISNIKKLIGEIKAKEGLPSLTKSSMPKSTLTFPPNTVKTTLPDGVYSKGIRDSYELLDDVIVQNSIMVNSFRLTGHVIWSQSNLEKEIAEGTEIIIKGEGFVPYTKKVGDSVMSPTKLIPKHIVGDVLSANAEFSLLFPEKIFPYPKPVTLAKYFTVFFTEKDFIVLDFFSGSATTAHAVMQLNAEDGGNRKFIMVQLPEPCEEETEAAKAGYKNICEIGKERIRRAGAKIKTDSPLTTQHLDTGFRVLKLDSSNMKDVFYSPKETSQLELFRYVDNVKDDRTSEDLLFQVMLELGATLDSKIEESVVDGKTIYNVADGYLVACFDQEVSDEVVTAIAKMQPTYAVLRDTSLANDATATNFEQIFKTYAPNTTTKIL